MGYQTYTIANYLECKPELAAKAAAIEKIIDDMLLQVANNIGNSGVIEYQYDDGQAKIKMTYRGIDSMKDAIMQLEQLKQMYLNRLRGRVQVLRDEKTFRR